MTDAESGESDAPWRYCHGQWFKPPARCLFCESEGLARRHGPHITDQGYELVVPRSPMDAPLP